MWTFLEVDTSYFNDFREYLTALEQRGWLRKIDREIDKDNELFPLVRWQYRGLDENRRFGMLFENVVDRSGRKLPTRVASSVIAAHRDMRAFAAGCTPDDIHDRFRRGQRNPIPPTTVQTGPVKEVIHTGEELASGYGLGDLSIPFQTNGWEGFPRITAGPCFSRDPDTGVMNVGLYNSIVLGPTRANLRTSRHLHFHWEKCRARGVPLQVALVVGAVPIVTLMAASDQPLGVYELDVAGGIIGQAIPVVRCETVDLEVPATAEIVIEGEIPTDRMEHDGPSGENRGHVMMDSIVHALEVTCITHRRYPIWHDIVEGYPPSESSTLRIPNCEALVMSLLKTHGVPYVRDVAFHHCGCARHLGVISFHAEGKDAVPNASVWQALYTAMSVSTNWPKILIAVDDDVDPHDLESVLYAAIDRCQPHRDVRVIPRQSIPERQAMDRSQGPPHGSGGGVLTSVLLMDATRKWAYPPVSLPAKDYMERAQNIWEELGLPPLTPRIPWYGASLGDWPDLSEQIVRLGEKGEYEEAAELMHSQPITDDDLRFGGG